MEKPFFITTPIFYINDRPHLGHAYTVIVADVIARYWRGKGKRVFFLTGTDENASKTVEGARKWVTAKIPNSKFQIPNKKQIPKSKSRDQLSEDQIREYTNYMAEIWRKTWDRLGISYDEFVRTTEDRHVKKVKEFFTKVQLGGDIYLGRYHGLYCRGHEAFLKKSELVDGRCPDHQTKPDQIEEQNYFFRLSKYRARLLDQVKNQPEFIFPPTRRNEILEFIERGLEDISISRPNLTWGIPVPGDPSQRLWVWFDALINYFSAGQEYWPADVHLVGKDIVRFHTVTWGAMLMSVGLPLPKQVVGHGFFTIDGQKISKSLGNAIDPLALARQYGNDAVRYYLLREIPFGEDGDFSFKRFDDRYRADLANALGNLLQRVIVLVRRAGVNLAPSPLQVGDEAVNHLIEQFDFSHALAKIWQTVDRANQLIDREKPWQLIGQTDGQVRGRLKAILAGLVEQLMGINVSIKPLLPETSQKILHQLKTLKPQPLFPKN